MTSQQKISVLALGVFAVAAITLGLLHLNQGIVKSMVWYESSDTIEQTDREKDDKLADLASKDTDNDSLTDYEELHVFNTSPYLVDTDGDGLDDAVEIQAGTDPNCPIGQECGATENEIDGADQESRLQILGDPGFDPEGPAPTLPAEFEQLLTGEDVSPEMLREVLKSSGADSQTVDSVDDEMLMKLYGDVLKQFSANTEGEQVPQELLE